MGLETATIFPDLNPAWPLGTDQKQFGDDHLRMIKTVIDNLGSLHYGVSAPSSTSPFMLWADTGNDLLKLRNEADSAWITIGDLTLANLGLEVLANKDTASGYAALDSNSEVVKLPAGAAAAGADDVMRSTGTWLKHNMDAADDTPPTVNDDSGDGYDKGSLWMYHDTGGGADVIKMCFDPTAAAAVWVTIGSE